MKSFGATFAGCLVIAVAVLALSLGIGRAQGGLQEPAARIVDLEVTELEIGKAVAYLFAKVNGRYVISPDVKGATTVSLRRVPFEGALANILKQVNATWRVRDGVYEIVLKPQPEIDWTRHSAEVNRHEGNDVRETLHRLLRGTVADYAISPKVKGRIKLNPDDLKNLTFEAALQRVLALAKATVRIEDGVYEILPQTAGQKIVSIEFKNEDVRDAIRKLFRSVDIPYSIGVDVDGKVTASLRNVAFDTALTNLLRQVSSTFKVENGTYQVIKDSGQTNDPSLLGVGTLHALAPVMTLDENFLYVLKGEMLYKVNKSDLKTVEMRKLGQ